MIAMRPLVTRPRIHSGEVPSSAAWSVCGALTNKGVEERIPFAIHPAQCPLSAYE